MGVEFSKYDVADYIRDQDDAAAYLDLMAHDNDPKSFLEALGDTARAYSMHKIATEAGVSRESLYRSLSREGNPRFSTIVKVLDAMGLAFCVVTKEHLRQEAEEREARWQAEHPHAFDDEPTEDEEEAESQIGRL